jgi:general secretion pathway protein I
MNNLLCKAWPRFQGFTLLEVMIAVAILAIALTALFGSQSRSLSLATETSFNTMAPLLAAAKMAELEAEVVALADDEGEFGDDFIGYTWQLTVEDAALTSLKALADLERPLQRATLSVKWGETKFDYTLVRYVRPVN